MTLLIQLRWTAVVGQVLTIAGAHFGLGIPLPLERMGAVIGALVLLNVSSLVWVRHRAAITNNELLVALMLDVAALTAQLYLSGGATNPFTSLFLLQVTLGAVLLDTVNLDVSAKAQKEREAQVADEVLLPAAARLLDVAPT